ncbi:DUF2639 domain-containing protein [Lederbergia citrea]|uniref:DUF2639 domain-containing protein n=1 Tax=Lederbergia citrea TaxID=2833581 RepID=A0A942Z477_9BACI|nr:DUF2639 domain-containing protein [Lederbergia citrea]MBS4176663.1 DUF2639 domain-containing protein [Lederbergia citrea]MBS4222105.1 DUF2639 domain-containing protein [Lederbergia citrea]
MAYRYSKGWYIAQLKEMGIRYHPEKKKKLESYKTYILRNLHDKMSSERGK